MFNLWHYLQHVSLKVILSMFYPTVTVVTATGLKLQRAHLVRLLHQNELTCFNKESFMIPPYNCEVDVCSLNLMNPSH